MPDSYPEIKEKKLITSKEVYSQYSIRKNIFLVRIY